MWLSAAQPEWISRVWTWIPSLFTPPSHPNSPFASPLPKHIHWIYFSEKPPTHDLPKALLAWGHFWQKPRILINHIFCFSYCWSFFFFFFSWHLLFCWFSRDVSTSPRRPLLCVHTSLKSSQRLLSRQHVWNAKKRNKELIVGWVNHQDGDEPTSESVMKVTAVVASESPLCVWSVLGWWLQGKLFFWEPGLWGWSKWELKPERRVWLPSLECLSHLSTQESLSELSIIIISGLLFLFLCFHIRILEFFQHINKCGFVCVCETDFLLEIFFFFFPLLFFYFSSLQGEDCNSKWGKRGVVENQNDDPSKNSLWWGRGEVRTVIAFLFYHKASGSDG